MSTHIQPPSPGSGDTFDDKVDFAPVTTERMPSSERSDDPVTRAVDGDQPINPNRKWWASSKEPGSATQIVLAAAAALAIGLPIGATQDVPKTAITLLAIPGNLWLRALTCTVLPLIIVAMVLAVQRLKQLSKAGPRLAKWTVLYYVSTTLIAVGHSTLLTGLVWRNLFVEADAEALQVSEADAAMVAEREEVAIDGVVVDMFNSFIPRNIVDALATNSLLAVLIASIVVGYLIKGPNSVLIKIAKEVEGIITILITFLIKIAPIGVFFLVLPNIMRLDIGTIGTNIGLLIGSTLANMAIHIILILPAIFYAFVRRNPYTYWFACSKAWITAWGTASSAATMPITLKEARARGNPNIVTKFVVPLGTLVNMDGTAIYFPLVVNFLAATQGIRLNAADFVIVILLSTLASIGTTPIPSASLVLVVMICTSINVPITGLYGLVTAIDWFLDRFRTAMNVSSDLYGTAIVYAITKLEDPPEGESDEMDAETREEQTMREGRETLQREKAVQPPV